LKSTSLRRQDSKFKRGSHKIYAPRINLPSLLGTLVELFVLCSATASFSEGCESKLSSQLFSPPQDHVDHPKMVRLCGPDLGEWIVELHLGNIGGTALTDGTTLFLFYLPTPFDVSPAGVPASLILRPEAPHIWSVSHVHDGIEVRDENPAYYIWTPGSNQYVDLPTDVNWGDDEARLFRCWAGELNRCVTYFAIRDCTGGFTDPLDDRDRVFIVSWAAKAEVVPALEEFGHVNTFVYRLNAEATSLLCREN
jgi:hypothetical protein